ITIIFMSCIILMLCKKTKLPRSFKITILALLTIFGSGGTSYTWGAEPVEPSLPPAATATSQTPLAPGSTLAPLDTQERQTGYVTREELDAELNKLAIRKGDFTFVPYGYVFASAVYDTCATVPGEFALYSQSKAINGKPLSVVDARSSRLGVRVQGPEIDTLPGYEVNAVFEADFEGLVSVSRNKGGFQLRKANVELNNKERGVRWMFGQDWEVISPLYPQMLAYLPAGFAGNIGYRRCQFRRDQKIEVGPNCKFLVELALADDIIGDFTSISDAGGRSSGLPIFEGRFAVSLGEEARCGLPITVGFSGHYGEQLYNFSGLPGTYVPVGEKDITVPTWSLNLDVDIPVTERFRIQGEYYVGENLSGFCGAINQGVDLFRRAGIKDRGGWICFHTSVTDKLCNNTGFALDKPDKDTLVGTSLPSGGFTNARTKNELIFTNFMYSWSKALMTGVELSYILTDYRKADVTGSEPVYSYMAPGETFRTEIAVKYSF
ncbi:MAG: hypothetical protein Q4G59_13460, partial [Planctomycetia bacterium]|nr:hypothetical protein [Planctomycetia bacterium]